MKLNLTTLLLIGMITFATAYRSTEQGFLANDDDDT